MRIGAILGIPLRIDYSWFIVFFFVTVSLASRYAHLHPTWSDAQHLLFGTVTSLMMFGSVVLHELGHSVVALHCKIAVRSITLFIFGGVAQIEREPQKPSHEFAIAIAGPLVSAALGVLFLGFEILTLGRFEGLASLGDWLGSVNLALAIFNLIPGFPLDGGRILRSILWKYTGSFQRATSMAAASGGFFAYLFIFVGITRAIAGDFFDGLWIAFIGWFLLNASQGSVLQARLNEALKGVLAVNVMSTDCRSVSGAISVSELVDEHLLQHGVRCLLITDGPALRGLITMSEVLRLPRAEWPVTSAQAVMIPMDRVTRVSPSTDIQTVLQLMNERNINQIPVVEGDHLIGIIARDHLLAVIQMYMELKA